MGGVRACVLATICDAINGSRITLLSYGTFLLYVRQVLPPSKYLFLRNYHPCQPWYGCHYVEAGMDGWQKSAEIVVYWSSYSGIHSTQFSFKHVTWCQLFLRCFRDKSHTPIKLTTPPTSYVQLCNIKV